MSARRLLDEPETDGLLLLEAWRMFLADHWQQAETLGVCWDLAQRDPAAAQLEAETAWGIGQTGNVPSAHYLVGVVAYFAPRIRAAILSGYRYPTGAELQEQLRTYRERTRHNVSQTPDWGPSGRRERWT